MGQTIFGGTHGKNMKDYFQSLQRPVAVQLEKLLEKGVTKDNAIKEIREMFLLPLFKFDIGNATIKDNHSDNYENVNFGGQVKKIFKKSYSYSIPFSGDPALLAFRPEIFHGSSIEGTISTNYDTEQSVLTVRFSSEQNNQANFEHEKNESIGELSSNANEANKEIKKWNDTEMNSLIESLYDKVASHIAETKSFNERNNIK